VHRDVKPGNILLQKEGKKLHVHLTDFGLARAYQESRLSGLTLTGNACGTPKFMAPEQITNARRVQPTSDQYSAAATLYWLLTKQYSHDFSSKLQEGLQQILLAEPMPIQKRRPDVPDALSAAVHRALSKDPDARFSSANAFRAALLSAVR
jgi:serine/threonine-protein kinase